MAPSPYIFIISIGPVGMNKYARFDKIPLKTLKDIKETKPYGRMDGQRENSIPTHKHSLRGGRGGVKKWWEPQYLANPPNLILSGV